MLCLVYFVVFVHSHGVSLFCLVVYGAGRCYCLGGVFTYCCVYILSVVAWCLLFFLCYRGLRVVEGHLFSLLGCYVVIVTVCGTVIIPYSVLFVHSGEVLLVVCVIVGVTRFYRSANDFCG